MKIQATPGVLKRFRRPTGAYQQTFRTPLERLPVFVAALLAGGPLITGAAVTLKAIVFAPQHLESLLAKHQLPLALGPDITITATGAEEVKTLLAAALADCVDFYFLPKPNRFLLYADHDEYTTVFAARRASVSRIASAMGVAGIADVPGYSRNA
jgi:hypothetical protein